MVKDKIIPSLCVVPIVGMHSDGDCGHFLGSGAFIGEDKILVTCDHVLSAWSGKYGFCPHEDPPKIYGAEIVIRDNKVDLAFLKVKDYVPPYSFPLANDDEILLNQFVCAFEYGTSTVAGKHFDFSPSNRIGNVTRLRNLTDMYGTAGDHMLELSFPALAGASGAPVILSKYPHNLYGIITANIARELQPAHVEKVYDESGNLTEETKFYLPQGLAIHVKHVRKLLKITGS